MARMPRKRIEAEPLELAPEIAERAAAERKRTRPVLTHNRLRDDYKPEPARIPEYRISDLIQFGFRPEDLE